MNQALWVAKTGLDAQQTRLSVISNNLANVSTTGFKQSRAVFEDLLDQNLRQVGANQNQTIQVDGIDSRSAQLGARLSTSGSIDETALAAAIAANDIVVNGNAVDLTGDATIEDVIRSINQISADSGITALKATSVSTAAAGLAVTAGTVSINGVTVSLVGGAGATDAASINAVSAQTGVTATANGNNILLSNTTGADIVVQDGTGSPGGAEETFHAGLILAGEVAAGAYTVTGTFAVEAGSNALGANQADSTLAGVGVLTGSKAASIIPRMDSCRPTCRIFTTT